jgi:hypothetical protein
MATQHEHQRRGAVTSTTRGRHTVEPLADCPMCWAQRMIWEPGPLGLLPVVCEECSGTGRSPRGSPSTGVGV